MPGSHNRAVPHRRTSLLLLLLALPWPACATAGLPRGFAKALAESPLDAPARLWLDGERVAGGAVALGPGGLPRPVRVAADGIAPGGETVFSGREWGPAGTGFRIEKRYLEGATESFRSVLLTADGAVLERAHSVPLHEVPAAVLMTAMAVGRDVLRCDIVADAARERSWSAYVRNAIGWTFVVAIGLDGSLLELRREVAATILLR